MKPEMYLILALGPSGTWTELGEFPGGWPESALAKYLGSRESTAFREFMVLSLYGRDVFTITPRTEYTVERQDRASEPVEA